MALNFPFGRPTTNQRQHLIIKYVDFELNVYGFDFAKNPRT